MLKPGMPHNHRAHSYFSSSTFSRAQLQDRPIHKARSTGKLNEKLQLDPYKLAHSTRDLSTSEASEDLEACRLQIEEELELKIQTLYRFKKYKEVTIPTSIKFAVTREVPTTAAMARPRSPSKSSCDTDLLDETLLSIRKRLTALSNDRVEMENKMDELMTGIKAVHIQSCKKQQKQQEIILPSLQLYSSIRRVKSSATIAKKPGNLISVTISDSTSAAESCSQECPADSPSQDTSNTLSPESSLSQPIVRQRSESAAASLRYQASKQASKPHTLSIQSAGSCGSMGETTTTIHELPESPRLICSTPESNSTASLLNYSTVHGRNGYRRTSSQPVSSSSPKYHHPSMVTSTPNVSQAWEKKDYYHTLPNSINRHSLPDSIMNTVIPEDQLEYSSVTESLSQLSTCTDEGSPKNTSGTIIRRSSLTGQIEHYRKPRSLSKKISYSTDVIDKPSKPVEPEFRVLNRGFRKSLRKNSAKINQIILPSIETAV